mgnify:FL=1
MTSPDKVQEHIIPTGRKNVTLSSVWVQATGHLIRYPVE